MTKYLKVLLTFRIIHYGLTDKTIALKALLRGIKKGGKGVCRVKINKRVEFICI